METSSQPPARRSIECSNCGAPIEYVEGESVLTCAYCGTAVTMAGFDKIVRVEAHYLLPARLQRQQVRQAVLEWMGSGWLKAADLAQRATITNFDGQVLPFWVVKASAHTFWSGREKKTRSVGSGDNRRTETYWEPVSGDFSRDYQWAVFAREDEEAFWGIEALNPGARSVRADWGRFFLGFGLGSAQSQGTKLLEEVEKFDLAQVSGMKVYNGQVPQARAESNARAQIVARHRQEAERLADRITDCDTTVEISGVDLVYVPLWQIVYQYRGRTYRILASAHDGRVIAGQAPVGKWDKVVILTAIMALVGGVCALVAYFGGVPGAWYGSGAAVFVAAVYALWTGLFAKG